MLQFNVHGKQRATFGPGRTLIKNFPFQIGQAWPLCQPFACRTLRPSLNAKSAL